MLALVLVALSTGLDNAAAALALGVNGVSARLRLEVALSFGVFEAGMPLLGLVAGQHAAGALGAAAKPVGGALLGVVGLVGLRTTHQEGPVAPTTEPSAPRRLTVVAAALSLDNLAIGAALGGFKVSLAAAAGIFGVVSVSMSLLALEIGGRLGARLGPRAGYLGGALLVVLGVLVGTGVL